MTGDTDHLTEWGDFFNYNPATRHRRRLIISLLRKLKFSSVLDVGCGDGKLLLELRRVFGCSAFGLDADQSPVTTVLRERLDGFYLMDISRERPGRKFDVVICSEALEHMQEDEKAFAGLSAVCGRHLLITVPGVPMRATDRRMGHIRHYTLASLNALAASNGFQVVESFAWGFPFHSAYKWMQDVLPDAMMRGFGKIEYGAVQKTVCDALYYLFFLNSRSAGGQIFLLGEKR